MHSPFAPGAQNEQLSTDQKVSGFTKVDMSLSKNCTFMHCTISIWVHVYEWLLLMSRWCLVLILCMCMSQFICTFCNVVVTVLIRAAVKYLHNTFFFVVKLTSVYLRACIQFGFQLWSWQVGPFGPCHPRSWLKQLLYFQPEIMTQPKMTAAVTMA